MQMHTSPIPDDSWALAAPTEKQHIVDSTGIDSTRVIKSQIEAFSLDLFQNVAAPTNHQLQLTSFSNTFI